MHVVKFIKQKRPQKILSTIPMPIWDAGTIQSPPTGRNSATVGTAFDFMLASLLYKAGNRIIKLPKINRTGIIPFDMKVCEYERIIYNRSDKITATETARSCIMLAKLHDSVISWNMSGRRGKLANIFRPLKAEIHDIMSMSKLVNISMFDSLGDMTMQSRICRGAVCDILTQTAVIDVKTVLDGTLTRRQVNQCLTYAMLCKSRDIRHVGIYFARHGKLFLCDISAHLAVKPAIIALFKE